VARQARSVTQRTRITFLGAGTVTGSKYLVEANGARIFVDCGLFQGLKRLRLKNWQALPIDVARLDAVLLTHAHLDHSGFLPAIVKGGFKGPVHCTRSTRALCGILLPDSGYLQEEDAHYANRKGFSKHRPALPLYTQKEAERSLEAFEPVDFDEAVPLAAEVTARFRPVGHILGAASVEIHVGNQRIVFSGDVGRPNDPVMRAPRPLQAADYLVVESTYGDRRHLEADPADQLGKVVCETLDRNGVVLIPSFAVGRAQSLLYLLKKLKEQGRVPADVPVYLNSPMAINATEIFCAYHGEHRLSIDECRATCHVAKYVSSVEESKALNERHGPMIIISASGMATGGRVLHHLRSFGPDPRNTVLFAGYQAAGTRGEALLNGATHVKIHGQRIPVRARVEQISGLSAHADYQEIIDWLRPLKKAPARVFVTHGEPSASAAFQQHLRDQLGWASELPAEGSRVELDGRKRS
jgi:metallo-beta-lactamase family protein